MSTRRRPASRRGPGRTNRARRTGATGRGRPPTAGRRVRRGRTGRSRVAAASGPWRRSRSVRRRGAGPSVHDVSRFVLRGVGRSAGSGPGQAEHPLAHDVALDVGGAAADRVGERLEVGAGPGSLAVDRGQSVEVVADDLERRAGTPAGAPRRGTGGSSSASGPGIAGAGVAGDAGDRHRPQRRHLGPQRSPAGPAISSSAMAGRVRRGRCGSSPRRSASRPSTPCRPGRP